MTRRRDARFLEYQMNEGARYYLSFSICQRTDRPVSLDVELICMQMHPSRATQR